MARHMITIWDVIKKIRKIHWIRYKDPVPEELRGWSHHTPPVRPRAFLGLGVSEITNRYCETRRDVYLRRILRIKNFEKTPPLATGSSVHKIFSEASREVRKILLSKDPLREIEKTLEKAEYISKNICGEDLKRYCVKLYKTLILSWGSEIVRERSLYGGDTITSLPWISELRIDGSLIGLSDRLMIDAIINLSTVVEIKTGVERDFHKTSLAGYALAIESNIEIPIDYGILIYVNGFPNNDPEIKFDVIYISPDLRKEFIDARDEVIDMILGGKDPGFSKECPDYCPFKTFCRG